MKTILLLLAGSIGSGALQPVTYAQATVGESQKKLTPEELKKMIDSKEKFFFLDVREPKELEERGTIKGYVNIPLSQLEARVKEIPSGVPIVSACARGVRAAKAAASLEKNGFKQITLCAMEEYKAKGFDLIYPKAN